MGDYAAAETHVNFGIATYDPDRHHSLTYTYSGHDPGVCCRSGRRTLLWLRGYTDQALDRCRRGHRARRTGGPSQHAGHDEIEHQLRPSDAAGTQDANGSKKAAPAQRVLASQFDIHRFYTGWALVQEGQVKEGIPDARSY